MSFAKGNNSGTGGGRHRLGWQQPTEGTRKSTAKKTATGRHSKDHGKHRGGSGGTGKGGAADGLGREA